ncbi:uncharacterized protein [Temnothorax longispinosus]|uniref:uncharacterized protein isoform X3 n=1 Tax=Temnothorax longispinosus TaxID=300112 RepID=UPI003A990D36
MLNEEMIRIDCLHIRLNRLLLLVVGLWPYQQSKFVRLQLILLFGILATFIIFQFTVLVTNNKCTSDLLIRVFSSALLYIIFAIKYISFSINTEIIKCLLEQLQHIYNELSDKNEIGIIEKYGSYAKRYTVVLLYLFVTTVLSLSLYLFCPYIFNILFSKNGTRSRPSLPLMTEYFVDQEKYFYLILFHTYMAFVIGSIAMLAIGTMFIVYQQHACGMFRIARIACSYRMTRAMVFETHQKRSLQNENLICKEIICAVDMHRKAMKSKFQVMFFLLIVVGVICTSLNFFRIFQVVSVNEYDIVELLLPVLFIVIQIIYMIMTNYLAQEITDYNNDVYVAVYNIQWYAAPLQIQKMIVFLLQRSNKAFNIDIAGLFVGSIEGAATLLSTAISYFTVLYSTRH